MLTSEHPATGTFLQQSGYLLSLSHCPVTKGYACVLVGRSSIDAGIWRCSDLVNGFSRSLVVENVSNFKEFSKDYMVF